MSLSKRIAYLGIADYDYLSARLLLLCGLGNTAMPKAAEAFEKIFKLFLMLEAKITQNKDLGPNDLKKYNHKITKLFTIIKSKIPAQFDKEWDDYFKMLQDSYSRRYPEHWKEYKMDLSLFHLDKAYAYFRNNVILNFPQEEQVRARDFGTFLSDAYKSDTIKWIKRQGGKTPSEILTISNQSFDELEINKDKL